MEGLDCNLLDHGAPWSETIGYRGIPFLQKLNAPLDCLAAIVSLRLEFGTHSQKNSYLVVHVLSRFSWSRLDMAVVTAKVTKLSNIDLQNICRHYWETD